MRKDKTFPAQTISWTEACRFSPCTGKVQEKELWEKTLPTLAVAISGIIITAWVLTPSDPNREPMNAYLIIPEGLLATLGLLYSIAHYSGYLNGRITLGEEAIIRKHFRSCQKWKYKDITNITFDRTNVNGKEINVMKLTVLDAQEITFGVSHRIDINRVKEYLESKGMEISGHYL